MDSAVITSAAFAMTPEHIARLRAAGVDVQGSPDLGDLDIPDPKYGEEIVGTLTVEEALIYRDLRRAMEVADDLERNAAGKAIQELGRQIAASDRKKSMREVLARDGETPLALDPETAETMFAAMQRQQHLHAMLHFLMGERLAAHSWRLGVRSKGRVVKIERRW